MTEEHLEPIGLAEKPAEDKTPWQLAVERNIKMTELERAVIEAAGAWRLSEGAPSRAIMLSEAIDALLAARGNQ